MTEDNKILKDKIKDLEDYNKELQHDLMLLRKAYDDAVNEISRLKVEAVAKANENNSGKT